MPRRFTPFANEHFYHVFNRGINKQPIFADQRDYNRMFQIMQFYSHTDIEIKYSRFLTLSQEEKQKFLITQKLKKKRLVDFLCFTFMPNHFHLLLRQNENKGITSFMSNFQNSYVRYFNTKHERIGPLFQGQFKAILIEDDAQLLHLTRYIHLNPYTSFVVKDFETLRNYRWSSYKGYLSLNNEGFICNNEIIMSQFASTDEYIAFVEDRADYQRQLDKIKHLLLEDFD